MKKEQFSVRLEPLVKIALEKEKEQFGYESVNYLINSILKKHILKVSEEEKIIESVEKRIDELEEKQNKVISELVIKVINELVIESKYNKALLARVAKTLELDKEV